MNFKIISFLLALNGFFLLNTNAAPTTGSEESPEYRDPNISDFTGQIYSNDEITKGYKTKSGNYVKIWSDHPKFKEMKNDLVLANRHYMHPRPAFETDHMSVFLGKDMRTMRVQRLIFTDIDANAYSEAAVVNSLKEIKEEKPSYFQISNDQSEERELDVLFTSVTTAKMPYHPHWAIRVGDIEIQVTADKVDNRFFGSSREGGVVISLPYEHAVKTKKEGRTEEWAIDRYAKNFNMNTLNINQVCKTKKTDEELWSDINETIKEYLSVRYNECLRNCADIAKKLSKKICGTNRSVPYKLAAFGADAFNAATGVMLSPAMVPSWAMDNPKRYKDPRELKAKSEWTPVYNGGKTSETAEK